MRVLTALPFPMVTSGADMIETVRISQRGKDQLAVLKRRTGVQTRNVLCRWALCHSLRDSAKVRAQQTPTDTVLDITWDTFGGSFKGIYLGLLINRAIAEGMPVSSESLAKLLRAHLHRGLASLAGLQSIEGISDLVRD